MKHPRKRSKSLKRSSRSKSPKRSSKRRSKSPKRSSRSKSSKPNLVKHGIISSYAYKNLLARKNVKIVDVSENKIHKWASKEERDAHMKKIYNAIVRM